MFELNAADYSLLAWVYHANIPAHSLSLRFHAGSLMVHCQTIEAAMKLWETRSNLQMPGRELCFKVNGTFYVGATL